MRLDRILFTRRIILTAVRDSDSDPENFDPAHLPASVINAVEADSFWCLSRLLDGIQDNYINQQPGIHRSVKRMQDLVGRIDGMPEISICSLEYAN